MNQNEANSSLVVDQDLTSEVLSEASSIEKIERPKVHKVAKRAHPPRKPNSHTIPTTKEADAHALKVIERAAKQTANRFHDELRHRENKSATLAKRAFHKFAELVGGKEKLLDTLHLTPPDRNFGPLIAKILDDPLLYTEELWEVAARHKVPLAAFVVAYKEARAIQLHLEAVEKLAKKMPAVSQQIGEDSLNRFIKCVKCEGRGRHEVIEGGEFVINEDGEALTVVCYECRGTGKVFKEHDLGNRKLMVQMVGIAEQKPLVQQTFNTQHNQLNANFTPGDGSFEQLMRATDKLLKVTPVTIGASTIVDAIEVVPKGTEDV